eukprot:Nk52_evm13s158 gene=Nk52_evmTU13s158
MGCTGSRILGGVVSRGTQIHVDKGCVEDGGVGALARWCENNGKAQGKKGGDVVVVCLGLDNAGKTTLLGVLQHVEKYNHNMDQEEEEEEGLGHQNKKTRKRKSIKVTKEIEQAQEKILSHTTTTIGFNNEQVDMFGLKVTMYDLGGGERIRGIWKNYTAEAFGCVWVVDANSDEKKIQESRAALVHLLDMNEFFRHKPVVILANKQDLVEAKSQRVEEIFNVDELNSKNGMGPGKVFLCSMRDDLVQYDRVPVCRLALRWLLHHIGEGVEKLADKIRADVLEQKVIADKEYEERKQRVLKMQMEREL